MDYVPIQYSTLLSLSCMSEDFMVPATGRKSQRTGKKLAVMQSSWVQDRTACHPNINTSCCSLDKYTQHNTSESCVWSPNHPVYKNAAQGRQRKFGGKILFFVMHINTNHIKKQKAISCLAFFLVALKLKSFSKYSSVRRMASFVTGMPPNSFDWIFLPIKNLLRIIQKF